MGLSTVYHLDASPGNGTRYRLRILVDSASNFDLVAWPDMNWSCGDFGRSPPSGEWMATHGLPRPDADAIAELLAQVANIHLSDNNRGDGRTHHLRAGYSGHVEVSA